jgi:hypothetical protein
VASELTAVYSLVFGKNNAAAQANRRQLLPKDLLVHARKVEGTEISKAIASAVDKARGKRRFLPQRKPSAFPSNDMPAFGSALVNIGGTDYIAQEITFERRNDSFVSGYLRFVGRPQPRATNALERGRIVSRDENGIPF